MKLDVRNCVIDVQLDKKFDLYQLPLQLFQPEEY